MTCLDKYELIFTHYYTLDSIIEYISYSYDMILLAIY